jgi:hypothetical protein
LKHSDNFRKELSRPDIVAIVEEYGNYNGILFCDFTVTCVPVVCFTRDDAVVILRGGSSDYRRLHGTRYKSLNKKYTTACNSMLNNEV